MQLYGKESDFADQDKNEINSVLNGYKNDSIITTNTPISIEIKKNGKLIAGLVATIFEDFVEVQFLAVLRLHQNKGLASLLIAHIEELCTQIGKPFTVVVCHNEIEAVKGFYKKIGITNQTYRDDNTTYLSNNKSHEKIKELGFDTNNANEQEMQDYLLSLIVGSINDDIDKSDFEEYLHSLIEEDIQKAA